MNTRPPAEDCCAPGLGGSSAGDAPVGDVVGAGRVPEEVLVGELAGLAKALGHPARIQILVLLLKKNACVCGSIVDELPLAQSTVSQHLKILKRAGLIRGEVDGPRVCYCIEPRALARLGSLVAMLCSGATCCTDEGADT